MKRKKPSGVHQPHLAQSALSTTLRQLVDEQIERSLTVEKIVDMLNGGFAGIASLSNAEDVADGRLLEKAIAAIAQSNPNLTVLTQLRIPVRPDALELVEKNPEVYLQRVTLDANTRTHKTYKADLVVFDRLTRVAYLVDIKRSLGSYESVRIQELRQRMLAAALVLPDLLWREHRRIAVEDTRVVILEAAAKRTDVHAGIWNLRHLDHLLGVSGAEQLVESVREEFARQVERNLSEAWPRSRWNRESIKMRAPEPENRATGTPLFDGESMKDEDPVLGVDSADRSCTLTRRTERRIRFGIAPPPPAELH